MSPKSRIIQARRTLERRIRQTTGCSILSEINRSRLERAKQLLLETGYSCRQVGKEAGFNSVKTFNRVFQIAEGESPKNFRKGMC